MNTESSKAERTRNFIIEKTAGIFNKKGFAGTSMSDLTSATSLTKGSIYGNFKDKEEVALAAFDYNLAQIAKMTREAIDKAVTFHDKLMVYAKIYKKISRSTIDQGGCPILNTATEADDTHELLKAKAATAISVWQKDISTLIRVGIKAGEFKKDTDVRRIAVSIIALIEGGIMISRVTGDVSSMDNVLSTVEVLISQIKK